MSQFLAEFGNAATAVEVELAAILAKLEAAGTPLRLAQALRHAVLGGGKRFRPMLLMGSARIFGVLPERALSAAAAVEFIHCYSLVHDDLPVIDNDEMRRGQPSVWKAFDDWTAVLTGDALQAMAFELLTAPACHPDGAVRAELVSVLAAASGPAGMVGGQALDLAAAKLPSGETAAVADITRLQMMKTGRLIAAACEMGAILGGAAAIERAALRAYGEHLGFAFQISDDLLDVEATSAALGKAAGKDAAAGKATLVGALGAAEARDSLERAVIAATAALQMFGDTAAPLANAARHMARREY